MATIDVKVDDVRKALPQDVLPNLNVAASKTDLKTIFIVPNKFLGKENFYRVNGVIKEMRGEWVSQGRHSYWWVPATEKVEL